MKKFPVALWDCEAHSTLNCTLRKVPKQPRKNRLQEELLTFSTSFRLSGKRGHGHADMENADIENADMENADMENADMENADMENADMENADMENADKHVKNSYMVDGLPCNRFGLPEKFHVSLKY